jgi:hypothetical protein
LLPIRQAPDFGGPSEQRRCVRAPKRWHTVRPMVSASKDVGEIGTPLCSAQTTVISELIEVQRLGSTPARRQRRQHRQLRIGCATHAHSLFDPPAKREHRSVEFQHPANQSGMPGDGGERRSTPVPSDRSLAPSALMADRADPALQGRADCWQERRQAAARPREAANQWFLAVGAGRRKPSSEAI